MLELPQRKRCGPSCSSRPLVSGKGKGRRSTAGSLSTVQLDSVMTQTKHCLLMKATHLLWKLEAFGARFFSQPNVRAAQQHQGLWGCTLLALFVMLSTACPETWNLLTVTLLMAAKGRSEAH